MLKKKISFQISHLKSLLECENSCVTVVKGFKGKLSLLPFHLGYLKHAVKELLDNKVSKYDPELNGIILGHSNIKVINYVEHSDSCKLNLNYLADIYLFSPAFGKNLTGVVNKKSKEHIGCLIHTAFNASIPKPRSAEEDLSGWLRSHDSLQLGDNLDFTVSKVDFSSRIPYISGTILSKECDYDYIKEESDSGICCQDTNDESMSTRKKKKKKLKEIFNHSLESDLKNEIVSYHDPDQIAELLNSNTQVVKGKRKKSERNDTINNDANLTPPPLKRIKKEVFSPEADSSIPVEYSSENAKEKFKLSNKSSSYLVPVSKIKKEITSPTNDSPSFVEKSKFNIADKNETYCSQKIKTEQVIEDLKASLLKKAIANNFSLRDNEKLTSPAKKKKSKNKTSDKVWSPNQDSSLSSKLDSELQQKDQKQVTSPIGDFELNVSTRFDIEQKVSKKRKRSSLSSADEDSSFARKAKRKKSRKTMDDLKKLTDCLLAETISQLK